MLIKFIKDVLPSKIVLIFISGFIFWLPFGFQNITISFDYSAPFIKSLFSEIDPMILYYSGLLIVFLQAVYAVRLNYKFILLNQRTYIIFLVFVLLSFFAVIDPNFICIYIAHLLWMPCIDLIFSQAENKINLKYFFNTGLLLGIGALFFYPVVIMIIFAWIMSFILNTSNIRSLLASVVGFSIIWLFYFYISVLTKNTELFYDFFRNISFSNTLTLPSNPVEITVYLYIILFSIIGIIWTLSSFGKQKIINRKYYASFLFFISLPVIAIAFYQFIPLIMCYFLILPLTFCTTNYLLSSKSKWVKEIIFILFLVSMVVFRVMF